MSQLLLPVWFFPLPYNICLYSFTGGNNVHYFWPFFWCVLFSLGVCGSLTVRGHNAAKRGLLMPYSPFFFVIWHGLIVSGFFDLDLGLAGLYPGRWECSAKYFFHGSTFSFTFAFRPPFGARSTAALLFPCFSISVSHLVFLVLLYTLKRFPRLWKSPSALFSAFISTLP